MKKPDTYQIVGYIGLFFVILFYIYDYFYLHLQPLTRYCLGMSFLLIFVISFVILKAKWGEASRVRVAKNFGKVISDDDVHLCFERNETSFMWEADFGGHKISFYLPKTSELFSIRQQDWKPFSAGKSLLEHIITNQNTDDSAEKMFTELRVIQVPDVSSKFVLQSRDAEFLQQLLSHEHVKNNLNNYADSKIKITFNGSLFEMKWQTGSNEELEDFTQICQTAIIFNQEMIALQRKS